MRKAAAILLLCIGILNAQERSISGGGSRRSHFSAGKSQAIGFNCPEDFGYYAHPSDCSQYYVCVFGGALLESCTGGLMYSNELQTCDWPRNVVCNDVNGPGISTVKITDPRTSAKSGSQILSATESLSTSSLKRAENSIRSREPVKSSGTSKSVFDDSSRLRQGRFILGQESTNQNFNSGFQAQETSSRSFNVVAASPSPKFVFPRKSRKTRDIHRRQQPSFFDHDEDFHEISFPTSALIAASPRGSATYGPRDSFTGGARDSATADPRDRAIRQTHNMFSNRPRDPFFDRPTRQSQERDLLERRPFLYKAESPPERTSAGFFTLREEVPSSSTFESTSFSPSHSQNQIPFLNRSPHEQEFQDFRHQPPNHRIEHPNNRHLQHPQQFRTSGPVATNHFSMSFSRPSEHNPRPFRDDYEEQNSQLNKPPFSNFDSQSSQFRYPPSHNQHHRFNLREPVKNFHPQFEQSQPLSRPNFTFPPIKFNPSDPDIRPPSNVRPENQLNKYQIEEIEEEFVPPHIEGSVPFTNIEDDRFRGEDIPASKEISSNTFSNSKFNDERENIKQRGKPEIKIISTNFATNNEPTIPARKPLVRLTTVEKVPQLDQTTRQPEKISFPKFQLKHKRNRNRNEESKAPHIPGTARQPELSKISTKALKDNADKKDRPLLPGVSSTNRFAAPTAAPAVAAVPASSGVGQSFYNDLINLNDTDYYYYYDDILYDDYYEPTVAKTTVKPPSRQSSRSRGNSPDIANSVSITSSVSSKGRGSNSRPSFPSSPISADSSFNSSPSSSFLGTFTSPPARTAIRTGGESSSFAKQSKKSSSKSSSPTRGSSSLSSTKTSPSGSPELVGKGPQRPAPVYPQPQVDTIALPCDPSVCVLPDCYCGQSPVPGNIPPQNVPQMVLLTFDDSVNDLNKKLYIDLFEKGRVNPNGCPIAATYYISHEWTDYSQVQNLYSDGHEIASHSVTHSFGEKFSTEKWAKEVGGQREIMSAYGGVRMEDIRGMRAPFLAIGGNNMFRMLYDLNFTYDSSMPVYENRPPSWPYTLDYKIFHDCMIPPCPTHSYPGVWQVPMVMWQDLTGGRCSMGDACTTPSDAEGVYKFLIKNFERHYTTNRSPLGLYYHAAWFTTAHHKEGFIAFLDTISAMDDVWLITTWQALQWVRNPVPLSQAKSFKPFQCDYPERPPRCITPKVCNVWHKGSVRYLKTCQQCPESYPWVGSTGVQSPLNDV